MLLSYHVCVKLFTWNRRHIWSLSNSDGIRTHNQLVRRRTLNHLAKLVCQIGQFNWLNDWVFVYELSGCGFESRCCDIWVFVAPFQIIQCIVCGIWPSRLKKYAWAHFTSPFNLTTITSSETSGLGRTSRTLHVLSVSIEAIHVLRFIFENSPFVCMMTTFLNKICFEINSFSRLQGHCHVSDVGCIFILW